jgi:hypothetical protein
MSIAKPEGSGRTERISLDSAATHILGECRMVLPGIQALFGFQLIAVFSERFSQQLSSGEQYLHYAAIILVSMAIALVMAPAAIHRQTAQGEVSERFIWLSSRLVLAGMLPLVGGLCLDVYLIGLVILEQRGLGAAMTGLLFAWFFSLWVLLPALERSRQHARGVAEH